ncbi:hypothetical protein AKJ09_07666 [Labilithrix luteola]|uniref:Uncharacterized protein n=1 Tax=Labilithrix luteola TaxID=1391654 RepID=A0A0K1Q5I9_9BACT|nr:hypothetical protein [Labilithrix luteola]AKV01003.1 hypothetical protein AKJ09_07666 [Labilithrix luteola]
MLWARGGGPSRHRSRPPRRWPGRVASALGWMLGGLCAFAVYANVLSDDTALRARAETVARQQAGCNDKCRMTRAEIQRSVLEYRADYEMEGSSAVQVRCRRQAIVVGDYACTGH